MSDRERRHDSGFQRVREDYSRDVRRSKGAHGITGTLCALLGAGAVLAPTEVPKLVDRYTGKPVPYTLAECIRDKDAAIEAEEQKCVQHCWRGRVPELREELRRCREAVESE